MLLDIRETVRNSKPIKYTLITLICIPFVLFGVGSYFAGGSVEEVAEVNGVAISQYELDGAYNQQRNRIQQMFGGNIPAGLMSQDAIREQALDGLITNQVVRSVVADQKFAVGDATLGKTIRENPAFHVDGKFDTQAYQDALQSNRFSVANYEASVREETALQQFQSGVAQTSFQLPSESERISQLNAQTRTIDMVRFSIDEAIETLEVSDEDTTAYFDENAENYKFPQRTKVQYVELKKSDIAADIEISDDDAQAYYDEYRARYVVPEARDASHILLEVGNIDDADEVEEKTKELEAIKARIDGGEAFADLAKEFSSDIGSAENGGSLGQISPGAMVPEFEQAVFELAAVGDVSEVVKTQFGVHLIKLDRLEPESGKPFDEVKDSIISTMQNDAADLEFIELRNALEENAASDPETLDVAADAANVEVKQSDWVDSDLQGDPLFSNPQVQAAAFSDDVLVDQNNSDIIELNNDHVLVLRTLEFEEPRPKTLDDVKDDIVATIKRERAEIALDEQTKTALDLIIKGTPVADVAKESDFAQATVDEVLTRQATVFDNTVVADIYALAKPAEGKTLVKSAVLQNGDRIAYALKAVSTPEPEVSDGENSGDGETPAVAETPIQNPRLGQTELAAMVAALREKADVSINE